MFLKLNGISVDSRIALLEVALLKDLLYVSLQVTSCLVHLSLSHLFYEQMILKSQVVGMYFYSNSIC